MTLRARLRALSEQSLIYGLSGALAKMVGLLIVPILLRLFTPADYAVIDLITAFGSAIGAILLLGSDAAVGYYYYREVDESGRRALLSTWLLFQFVLNTLAGLLLFAFADPVARLLLGAAGHNGLYLQLIAAVFPLSSTFAYILEVLRLQMRPRSYLLISAINVFSGLFLTLLLVVTLRLGLSGIYLASALTNVVAFATALLAIHGSIGLQLSLPRLRAVLIYGVPLVPITLASWAITMSNRFFINGHTGRPDVGLFSGGNKVAQIMFLAVTAFSLAWGPFAYSIAEEPDAPRTYAKILTYYVAVMGWLALALSLFAPLILEIARPAYARAYQVVAPLALAYLVAGAYNIVAVGTSLSRKTIHLSWTTIIAAAVTIALNAVLLPLPYLALVGGALATLGGNLVLVGLVYMVSQRLYPIPYERGRVTLCAALLAAFIMLGQLARIWLEPTSFLGFTFRAALLLAYPLALVVLGVVQRYEVLILRNAVKARLVSGDLQR